MLITVVQSNGTLSSPLISPVPGLAGSWFSVLLNYILYFQWPPPLNWHFGHFLGTGLGNLHVQGHSIATREAIFQYFVLGNQTIIYFMSWLRTHVYIFTWNEILGKKFQWSNTCCALLPFFPVPLFSTSFDMKKAVYTLNDSRTHWWIKTYLPLKKCHPGPERWLSG